MPGSCYLFPFREQIDELSTAHLRLIPDGCMKDARSMNEADGIAEVFMQNTGGGLAGWNRKERGQRIKTISNNPFSVLPGVGKGGTFQDCVCRKKIWKPGKLCVRTSK